MLYAPEFVTAEVAYCQERVGAVFTAVGRSRRRSDGESRYPLHARRAGSATRRIVATR